MDHKKYIQRCLQIAKNGIGTARPNPSVGAVVVYDNKIIAEGFTSPYGKNHAEVNAIAAVKDKSVLKSATIYVTLEPCSHFGKTPPCADLIVKHQFKKVVIGCVDSNSLVSGKGIERLQNAGIEVVIGVLEDECRAHHKRFFTDQEKKRPYIILKWAETKDGFVAPISKNKQGPVWISNPCSQQLVHKWRAKGHAILVGTNTVVSDNPKLNVRSWFGQNPVRIVIDRTLRIPENLHVFDGSVKTIFITEKNNSQIEGSQELIFETINFSKNMAKQICDVLYKHNIQSVIIEGGTKTLQNFIDENLWDEARVFTGDVTFGKGVLAPIFNASKKEHINIQKDVLKIYTND
ncbi:bifunctional diaminohydroxyphosphoribosylaminopyrimidine deaminase/5-amino-6-(5-phosphoribosylamino)uracil reductase RibD [Polaribacter septentrionalilitoris]|uniref:bifunctional diaminohydroxyphosphoribosylaminopyrimidine deaminase/5-amino-6-(5-phosphoribosylamino)uracil reductase RibD n=1 Tax=Polaribacter septentrionalilitoris TaxID=2494657 RepID=UPI001EEDFDE3|nr:bifunctional diaminohydroxyphosphoribosylaminopyrimidine deaminase/5-amino-6-(5-phosphoribosylamino)uracil reductase RibD [Polaribacter septentrionalilitoris]